MGCFNKFFSILDFSGAGGEAKPKQIGDLNGSL